MKYNAVSCDACRVFFGRIVKEQDSNPGSITCKCGECFFTRISISDNLMDNIFSTTSRQTPRVVRVNLHYEMPGLPVGKMSQNGHAKRIRHWPLQL